MDKKVLRERMRKKQRQMMIRKYTKMATYVVAAVLLVVFVVRGVIMPIANRAGGGKDEKQKEVQAEPQTTKLDPNIAMRQPLMGAEDSAKLVARTPGWHDSEDGRWYQNTDGTYFVSGFQEIDGVTYSFDDNGYIQTGWVTKGANDYYFNKDGSYNPAEKKPMLALTFDDGPGEYTDRLLDCLEQNNAKATFFMQGQNVEGYQDTVKRMMEIGCELGSHSYDHTNLYNLDADGVAKQFKDTDAALIEACGQPASVARAPYGNWSEEIINAAGKPFFMWSLDTKDWQLMNAEADYNAVMNGDLTDGSIILMHDIHEPSVEAAIRLIPDLIAKGYKLVTVSEMAQAKGVDLQLASYSDFWQSSLDNGTVAGYKGTGNSPLGETDTQSEEETSGEEEASEADGETESV